MSDETLHGARLVRRFRDGFPPGWTAITPPDGGEVGIEFGIFVLEAGGRVEERHPKESVWVLLHGKASVASGGSVAEFARTSLFDEMPSVLHVAPGERVAISAPNDRAEWAVARTENPRSFPPRVFGPADVGREWRGEGLAQGACRRQVRLVFDADTRPESNLVVGEVACPPGRWSSWPPHHHAQPEIYHYRFTLPQGYGHAELGQHVYKVHSHDTLLIPPGHTHAQAAAPGYGMWYLWIVRHLPGSPYRGFEYEPEHVWMLDRGRQGWEPHPARRSEP